MLSKYKIALFNATWSIILMAAAAYLYPFIFSPPPKQEERVFEKGPILQEGSLRTIWKRGKHKSTTTIKEKTSLTQTEEKKSHSSTGWTTIIWRKGDT
ncbi:MAG: hypothetical protein SP4CHLAM5_09010 [Chlamydiia bacterium]|nr:hypothetical protein [Chlamydiia bacterium]MCH9618763.1 hypothetical protein [Chlamydiia bacterium]MCH9624436.1 hypothetical protein [Chlamydiia bacterium]